MKIGDRIRFTPEYLARVSFNASAERVEFYRKDHAVIARNGSNWMIANPFEPSGKWTIRRNDLILIDKDGKPIQFPFKVGDRIKFDQNYLRNLSITHYGSGSREMRFLQERVHPVKAVEQNGRLKIRVPRNMFYGDALFWCDPEDAVMVGPPEAKSACKCGWAKCRSKSVSV